MKLKHTDIQEYLNQQLDFDLMDFYNRVSELVGESQYLILENGNDFLENSFLNKKDAVIAVLNDQSSYNLNHKFVLLVDYYTIVSSDTVKALINMKALVDLVIQYDEVLAQYDLFKKTTLNKIEL